MSSEISSSSNAACCGWFPRSDGGTPFAVRNRRLSRLGNPPVRAYPRWLVRVVDVILAGADAEGVARVDSLRTRERVLPAMTISVTEYFQTRKDDRKKETRYLNVINKDSCTSCQSCATVCPVDCIYEVPSNVPGQSYHQIDTSRCIGCQMCYRSPSDSSDLYTLTICPWNAIDMLHNPNVSPDKESILLPYWKGTDGTPPWAKLEEYGYQFFIEGQCYLPTARQDIVDIVSWLAKPHWLFTEEGDTVAIAERVECENGIAKFVATDDGRELLDCIFTGWSQIFMD